MMSNLEYKGNYGDKFPKAEKKVGGLTEKSKTSI